MTKSVYVVDGSNLAHAGRAVASLARLLTGVESLRARDNQGEVVVFVDPTLRYRVNASERADLERLVSRGEIATTPARTVGRGDVVFLSYAKDRRLSGHDVVVVSNDNFSDSMIKHPWLSEPGRVLGGTFAADRWVWADRQLVASSTMSRPSSTFDDHGLGPTVAAVGANDGHLEVWRIRDGRLMHRWFWGRWSEWQEMDFPLDVSVIAVAAALHGEAVDLWTAASDGRLRHRWWTESSNWSPWEDWGEGAAPLAAASAGANHVEVWAMRGGRLQHRWNVDGWTPEWSDY